MLLYLTIYSYKYIILIEDFKLISHTLSYLIPIQIKESRAHFYSNHL